MRSKSLIALSILCLALGACATTDTATEDPNVASAEDHANQGSMAARADDVTSSTLTPNTEQTTVTTTTTKPAWDTSVEVTDNTADISDTTLTTTTRSTSMTSSSTTVVDDDDDTTTTTETETRKRLRKD